MSMIEVSCPSCETLNIIELKQSNESNSIDEKLNTIFGNARAKQYTFEGENKCTKCIEKINVILTVSNNRFSFKAI